MIERGPFDGHAAWRGPDLQDSGSWQHHLTDAHVDFHTDGSDVVCLLCLTVAKTGGGSAIVSSVSVYNEVLRQRPALAELHLRRGGIPATRASS